ncbi:hypothetical protein [Xanthomonas sp. GPE 39]|uniref:hypothetical protein n=1 Tax=Xanthomonas sp. GPE 39 TaxID=1583099 RepID=UPI000A4089BB|nr:hypothetical protein [Xanthomonas sp. GPE 39]
MVEATTHHLTSLKPTQRLIKATHSPDKSFDCYYANAVVIEHPQQEKPGHHRSDASVPSCSTVSSAMSSEA